MIIGGSGSGKSRLALRLSRLLDIAVYCVDKAVHDEKEKLRTNSEIDSTVRSWASKHQWIIEGGSSRTYSDRASRATVLVFMKPPRWLRVYQVAIRDKLNFSLLYWSFKNDEIYGVRDGLVLGLNS
jgi:adenylate kinase family enzyme